MKNNVIDMRTKEIIDNSKVNTRVYGMRFNPNSDGNWGCLRDYFKGYSKLHKVGENDARAYVFMYNVNSSKEFVKQQVMSALKAIWEILEDE
jgi:hypothetical protein